MSFFDSEKLSVSLLAGTVLYIITVLINLIQREALAEVFRRGLIALLLGVSIIWLLITLIEYFNSKMKEGSTPSNPSSQKNNSPEGSDNINRENEQAENDFSPMDPTVLEVDEKEAP
ncbi:MAG: hypothetical protein ACOCVB_02030 [Bacillota bacterium]